MAEDDSDDDVFYDAEETFTTTYSPHPLRKTESPVEESVELPKVEIRMPEKEANPVMEKPKSKHHHRRHQGKGKKQKIKIEPAPAFSTADLKEGVTPHAEIHLGLSDGALQEPPETKKESAPEEEVVVKNLDTGEVLSVSQVESQYAKNNPLGMHLRERGRQRGDDQDSDEEEKEREEDGKNKGKSEKKKKRGFFHKVFGGGEDEDTREMAHRVDGLVPLGEYVPVTHHKRHVLEYGGVHLQQHISAHVGAVWTMKFNPDGRFLATGGQDMVVRVWVVSSAMTGDGQSVSSFGSSVMEETKSVDSGERRYHHHRRGRGNLAPTSTTPSEGSDLASSRSAELQLKGSGGKGYPFFEPKPFRLHYGHTADVLDLAWSKNNLLLTSSMDKTVRLWHVSRNECLCYFQHVDFVTAIAFHPLDDRVFISGSLDEKLRKWNIPEKKVVNWVDTRELITAVAFNGDGKTVITGSYGGKATFYHAEDMRFITQVQVRSRRGKNRKGKKITGIEVLPEKNQMLITSNDSRIRLYYMNDYSLACKYKGLENQSSQSKATFSPCGQYIICGSENQRVYIWKTENDYVPSISPRFTAFRKDRSESHETFCALFAPVNTRGEYVETDSAQGSVIVTAEYGGSIKVFDNNAEPEYVG